MKTLNCTKSAIVFSIIALAFVFATASAKPGVPDSLQKGTDLFNKSMAASGGLEAFQKVKNLWIRQTVTRETKVGQMQILGELTIVYPDSIYQSMMTLMGEAKYIMVRDSAWMITVQGKISESESEVKDVHAQIMRDPVHFFTHADEFTVRFVGEKTFADSIALDLLLSCKEGSFHLYLNPTTYLPSGISYADKDGQGKNVVVEEVWSDYHDIGGIQTNFKTVATIDSKKLWGAVISEAKINVQVDPKVFEVK